MKFVPVPCKCGITHDSKPHTWIWSWAKVEGEGESTRQVKVKRCLKCRQILQEQGVEFMENSSLNNQQQL